MQTLNITIGEKTYHVEVPPLSVGALQVVVDGRPIEICLASAQDSPTELSLHAQPTQQENAMAGVLPTISYKPKMTEYTRSGD